MKVLLDGNEIPVSSSLGNLEEVLAKVSQDQEYADRVLWTVTLNGERYDEKKAHHAREIKVGDIRTLNIGTINQNEICQLFLQNSELILLTLRESAEKIVRLLRSGEVKEANYLYLNFLETYHYLIYMLKLGGDSLKSNSTGETGSMIPITEQTALLENLLKDMLDAQENEDWIMLADIFEIQVSPLLKNWQELSRTRSNHYTGSMPVSA